MEEIQVGEYVRTQDGQIFKTNGNTLHLSDDKRILYKVLMKIPFEDATYEVKKCRKNIIDLLEEGDYVNGYEIVTVFGYDEDGNDKDALGIIEVDGENAYGVYLEGLNIKTIVTKEQFKAVEYSIGE